MLSILVAFTIFIGIVLVVLLLFVLGKLNWLENATNSMLDKIDVFPNTQLTKDASPDVTDPYFYGLTGKKLWSCITESDLTDLSSQEIEEIRPRYAIVLVKALAKFIKDEEDDDEILRNIRTVKTTRGKIDIWIPSKTVDKCDKISEELQNYEQIEDDSTTSEGESASEGDVVISKKDKRAEIEKSIQSLVEGLVKKARIKYSSEMATDLIKIVF